MGDLKRGDVVRVLGAKQYSRYDGAILPAIGSIGTVTGRSLGDLIEVNIRVESTGKLYGYLLLPEELTKENKE